MSSSPVSDDEYINTLKVKALHYWGWGDPYRVHVAEVQAGQIDLEIRQGGSSARVLVPLPSSGQPTPWVQLYGLSPAGWVEDLRGWLNEEMDTGGLKPWNIYLDAAGVRRFRARPDY